jgi:hypothetical protein
MDGPVLMFHTVSSCLSPCRLVPFVKLLLYCRYLWPYKQDSVQL